jgi:hypothetical protein
MTMRQPDDRPSSGTTILPTATVQRMESLAGQWEAANDARCVFLKCYTLMTGNMLAGVQRRAFGDAAWVETFVDRFAAYYFIALDAYERDAAAAPRVWQLAHDVSADRETWAIQKLLLGINAHINYDLVLTLDELLRPGWPELPGSRRVARRADYDAVNTIIAQTIDAVQDEVLEPAMPVMQWIDRLLGPADERLLSRLLTGWRDHVWDDAIRLIEAPTTTQRAAVIAEVETAALRRAKAITLTDWRALDAFV